MTGITQSETYDTKQRLLAVVLSGVMVLSLATAVLFLQHIDRLRQGATLEEVLYVPSPRVLKAMSLGYTGLMADIYWTRAVQYFGAKHRAHAEQYRLLAPLLDITTTLDPHLIVAYRFGSTFLTQKPPDGAGDPGAAVALIERGIRANPDTWELYFELGFVKYMDLHDPAGAAQAFERGAQISHSHPFLRVLAAAMAQHAGERAVARALWMTTYQSSDDAMIRENAVKHLRALDMDEEVERVQQIVDEFTKRTGAPPQSLAELVRAGYLSEIPGDPFGHPLKIVNGRVEVPDPSALPFITQGLPPGSKSETLPIANLPK
jgi:hypothetical protein